MNRNDFEMLESGIIYFDNGATTLKPKILSFATNEYYNHYSANAHRGDYDISLKVDTMYEGTRKKVRDFINARSSKEIIFTNNCSDSLNKIIFGYYKNILKKGDEVIITKSEHASNVLPWYELKDELGIVIKYIELNDDNFVTIDNFKACLSNKTKVVSLAQVTNVIGDKRDIKKIAILSHAIGADVIVDAAQSIAHTKVDVQDLDVDFFAFSGHKMCGPTGVGVLYGKYHLLEEMTPTRFGGGSNARYNSCGLVKLKNAPTKFETGTPNIEGVIGLGSAIEYLQNIGMKNIEEHEAMLRKYAVEKMKELDNIEIYNENGVGAIAFNIKNVFSQDGASLFNTYGIAIRAGQHCAKILDEYLHVSQTLRASFYFYNTKEEIDQFIEVCKKGDDFLDAFFG